MGLHARVCIKPPQIFEIYSARGVSTQKSIMTSCSESVTASRFERRVPGGRLDLVFKVAFGNDAAAARALHVSKMTVWRWRHDRSPLPKRATETTSPRSQTAIT
jgi:hypothetical protein